MAITAFHRAEIPGPEPIHRAVRPAEEQAQELALELEPALEPERGWAAAPAAVRPGPEVLAINLKSRPRAAFETGEKNGYLPA
jgi:hypothetical protein